MNFFRRGPDPSSGPFFYAVDRGDQIPIAPMSDHSDGLDEPAPERPAMKPATLAPGDHVGPLRYLRDDPAALAVAYPLRIYQLRDVADLRLEAQGKHYRSLVASDAIIEREVPAWRYFGPHGDGVPEILEAIWRLDEDRISRLKVPPGDHPFERIPVPLLAVPDDHRGARNAVGAVTNWVENRSWAAGQGGGFYYRGCYFTYIVSDPQWLMAMGLAYNAAAAIARGPAISADERREALSAWASLVE